MPTPTSQGLLDLRIAFRQHRRQPGFALTVLGTLALTVGATTAVFAVVGAVLVKALPFASPERLVWIASVRADSASAPFTLPEYMDYRGRARTLSGLAAYANWSASLAGDGITERLQGARMSANAFDVLGVAPAAGRLFDERDDRPDAPRVVVLSHRLWQRRYGGAADLIGATARINGESFVIAGVLPAEFPLPLRDIDVVTPLAPDRDPLRHVRNSVNFLRLFGRLAPDADTAEAQAELTGICRALRRQFPVEYSRKEAVRVDPLHEAIVGQYRQAMVLLSGAVAVVLATALANLASLALVRAAGRRAELTMRIAIGASRTDLVWQVAVEAAILAATGGVLGWAVAGHMLRAVAWWATGSIPRLGEVRLDGTALAFVAAVAALATALLAGAALAAIARTRAGDVLRLASRGAIDDRWSHRMRRGMVVGEIAAALVLLLATVVLVQGLWRLENVYPGYDPDGVFQARISIPPTYRMPDDVSRFYDRLSERLVASPGVEQLGVISVAPLSGLLVTVPFSVAGQATATADRASANLRAISPGYLSAVRTRLLHGRSFAETDRSDTPSVALVSASLADRFLAGRPLGQRLLIDDNNTGPRPIEVVGVVENVRHAALDLPPAPDIYVPLRQVHPHGVGIVRNNQFWMVRTASDPSALRAAFLAHLRAVDPDAAVSDTGTMRQFFEASLGPQRLTLALIGAFALTAVLLAVIGLYGLASYAVSQRRPEIGLRLAIGATPGEVQWMILRQAAWLGAVGAGIGLVLAAAMRPVLSSLAPSIGTGGGQGARIDPAAAAAVTAFLVCVVLLAAWRPARRASRIAPTLTLNAR
jgi:predicted permease